MKHARRIRVLLTVPHLTSTASPYREMMAIARYLSREEFDLTVCSLRPNGYEEAAPLLKELNVRCAVIAFRPTGRTARHFLTVFSEQARLSRLGLFDIQHSMDFTSSPFEALMARLLSRKFLHHQRNLNENGHRLLFGMKVRLANGIVAIADHMIPFLLENGAKPGKLRKVYNGIDLEAVDQEICRNPAKKEDRLLVVGQFERRKRHEDAITAFSLLAADYPGLRLAIAGGVYDAGYSRDLRVLAAKLNVQDRVDFLGVRSDIPRLMHASRAALLCSESEGQPWALVEGMASRVPLIASDIAANREIIEHGSTGLLVTLGDCRGYADAVRTVLDDPERARLIANRARLAAETKYSAAAMVNSLQEVYRELAALRPPA